MGDHAEQTSLMVSVSDEVIDELLIAISNAKREVGLPMAVLPTDKFIIQMLLKN